MSFFGALVGAAKSFARSVTSFGRSAARSVTSRSVSRHVARTARSVARSAYRRSPRVIRRSIRTISSIGRSISSTAISRPGRIIKPVSVATRQIKKLPIAGPMFKTASSWGSRSMLNVVAPQKAQRVASGIKSLSISKSESMNLPKSVPIGMKMIGKSIIDITKPTTSSFVSGFKQGLSGRNLPTNRNIMNIISSVGRPGASRVPSPRISPYKTESSLSPTVDFKGRGPTIGPGGESPTPSIDFKGRGPTVFSSVSTGATRAVKNVGETLYSAIGGTKREVESRISRGISTIERAFSPKTIKRAAVTLPVIGTAPIVGPAALGIGAATYAARKAYGKIQRGGSKPKIGVYDIRMGYIPLSGRGTSSTKTKTEPKPLPSLSDIFAPTRAYYGFIGSIAEKGEKEYQKRVVHPVEMFIGGKRERALAEQQEKIQHLGEKVKKYEKSEWRTKQGIVLPTEPTSEVRAWQQKWSPLIRDDKFLGTEAQFREYERGFKRYYKEKNGKYYLREKYMKYTPEAQKYAEAVEEQGAAIKKYETMPKPSVTRQFAEGFIGTVVGVPGFIAFTTPRVLGQSIMEPTAVPSRTVAYGKGMYLSLIHI